MEHNVIIKQIQELETELARLKEELNKTEKFEFKYQLGTTFKVCTLDVLTTQSGADHQYINNFKYRQTLKNAQADFKLQKELMCIGALAEQIDPDFRSKVIWDGDRLNCYIYFDTENKWYSFVVNQSKSMNLLLGVVYMPYIVAEKVCEILNNKGVEL